MYGLQIFSPIRMAFFSLGWFLPCTEAFYSCAVVPLIFAFCFFKIWVEICMFFLLTGY
jgi:hypothetical protein